MSAPHAESRQEYDLAEDHPFFERTCFDWMLLESESVSWS